MTVSTQFVKYDVKGTRDGSVWCCILNIAGTLAAESDNFGHVSGQCTMIDCASIINFTWINLKSV